MVYRSTFCYAVLVGALLGTIWGIESLRPSRWNLYQAISLGESREEVVSRVDSFNSSTVGCGVRRGENAESVCRFEDVWRGYTINFDPTTQLVNRKRFYFRFVREVR